MIKILWKRNTVKKSSINNINACKQMSQMDPVGIKLCKLNQVLMITMRHRILGSMNQL